MVDGEGGGPHTARQQDAEGQELGFLEGILGRFRARKALVKLPGLGAQVSQGTVEDRDQAPVAGEEDTSRLGVRVCVSEERRGSQADSTESRVDWGVDEGEVGCP